jgi:uncharacterized protein (DUF1501 family)
MLRVCSSSVRGSRRVFLEIGTAAIGGLSLPKLLAAKAGDGSVVKDRSVVVLNLQGGPTQFETFDPNMEAPSSIRSITGEIQTTLPGVTFGGTLPKLAALADKMAIVRSYRHGISDHGTAAMHVMAGGNPTGAMMGALYARVAGLTNAQVGLPRNVLVTSRALGNEFKELYFNAERVSQNGSLPVAYRPFDPSAGGELIENMRLHVREDRWDDRRGILAQLDVLRRQADAAERFETADRFQQQAMEVLLRGAADAFDLKQEDPRLVEQYDTGMMEPSDETKKRNEYARQFSPVALGKQMLLARRLCEAGCGFVTVTCPGWDMHGGGKEFTMVDGVNTLTPALDKAVSAFIDDVSQRGQSDKILLVITGEFGRTPRVNQNGGRDHWGNLCTLAFVGGGLRMGQVIGRSDRTGSHPVSDPISSGDVLATIMHSLFDIGQLRLRADVPSEVAQATTNGQPIRELI